MTFGFPAHVSGFGVDPVTGKGEPSENISDEEGIEILLQISGESYCRVIPHETAMKIYEIVWHFLNREESNNLPS